MRESVPMIVFCGRPKKNLFVIHRQTSSSNPRKKGSSEILKKGKAWLEMEKVEGKKEGRLYGCLRGLKQMPR